MTETPYEVLDGSGSITGRGWRVSGPAGFWVFADNEQLRANQFCAALNLAHRNCAREMTAKLNILQNKYDDIRYRMDRLEK